MNDLAWGIALFGAGYIAAAGGLIAYVGGVPRAWWAAVPGFVAMGAGARLMIWSAIYG